MLQDLRCKMGYGFLKGPMVPSLGPNLSIASILQLKSFIPIYQIKSSTRMPPGEDRAGYTFRQFAYRAARFAFNLPTVFVVQVCWAGQVETCRASTDLVIAANVRHCVFRPFCAFSTRLNPFLALSFHLYWNNRLIPVGLDYYPADCELSGFCL